MPVSYDSEKIDSTDVGWRLKQLRLRRGLRQSELADRSGVDAGYLNRLEKSDKRKAKPKPDTVNRILDALEATVEERCAVFRVELPPLTRDEIMLSIGTVEESYGESDRPIILIDHHWIRWYHNRTMRQVLGMGDEEYAASVGELPLYSLLDPGSPTYERIPEEERLAAFGVRAQMFKMQFAGEEFDRWYLDIVHRIRQFPEAAAIWDNPTIQMNQLFLDSHEVTLYNPILCTNLYFQSQFNRLLKDPRFTVVHLTPMDQETEKLVEELRKMPVPGTLTRAVE